MDRIEMLEERIAHLIRAVEDMSDVVAQQGREIDRLTRHTHLLMEREAEREAERERNMAIGREHARRRAEREAEQ